MILYGLLMMFIRKKLVL